jgi:hypothetical protein
MTVEHSVGGKFTLPIGGPFEPFDPPRPNAEDAFRKYEARVRVVRDRLVNEFEVTKDGRRLWREVTTYRLESEGNLVAEDQFFVGEPMHLKRSTTHVFVKQERGGRR